MKFIYILLTIISLIVAPIGAQVSLPKVFADNMMFQRNKPIKIWGAASKGEAIQIVFNNATKKTKADKNGKWQVELPSIPEGGPYALSVHGKANSVEVKNILIGDIWFCSGQSNMEMPINGWGQVYNFEQEVKDADYPQIRTFNVEKAISTIAQDDVNGQWLVCSPNTAANFSATAYFFARKLYNELNIPIGIINSSWGGTDIEPWISRKSFDALSDEFKDKYPDLGIADFDTFINENNTRGEKYYQALNNDPGLIEEWYASYHFNWESMIVPEAWSQNHLDKVDGIVWFQQSIELPKGIENKTATISLGGIDDNEVTWINGHEVGRTDGYDKERIYTIAKGVLKEGENTITVRVFDGSGNGGMYSSVDKFFIKTDDEKFNIAGQWKYKEAVTNIQYNYTSLSANSLPSLLYNGMVSPLLNMPVQGVIWYQGENNANEAYNYRMLFPTLINDWRKQWDNAELPFYWVQLANFMAKDAVPSQSAWAELREAQNMALVLPHTGQAVITDIGDTNDIHPRNKQDVGLRLALIALNKDYAKGNEYSGPRYLSHTIETNKIIVQLSNAEELNLTNKYGYIEGFAIAAQDGKFEWAKANLQGNKIVVYSDKVQNPVAVRYGWSNNPDVDIYNSANLPLAPFRTDAWDGITKKQ